MVTIITVVMATLRRSIALGLSLPERDARRDGSVCDSGGKGHGFKYVTANDFLQSANSFNFLTYV